MSWENVDGLPGQHHPSDPFRSASEPVVAERRGLSVVERGRLFFLSTPALPSSRTAESLVVTPEHLYVRRQDGSQQRVALEQLRGRRQDGGRIAYGVIDGDDVVLLRRPGCPVEALLDARLAPTEAQSVNFVSVRHNFTPSVVGVVVSALAGVYLLVHYDMTRALPLLRMGHITAESVMGHLVGWAGLILAVLVGAFGPLRIRVDELGVHRARGLVPWWHYEDPPEAFEAVFLGQAIYYERGQARCSGYSVFLTQRPKANMDVALAQEQGGARPRRLLVQTFRFSREVSHGLTTEEARVFAVRLSRVLRIAFTTD